MLDKPSGTYACPLCPDLEFKRARARDRSGQGRGWVVVVVVVVSGGVEVYASTGFWTREVVMLF